MIFFRFWAATHISGVNCAEMVNQDNVCMKFAALNIDCSSPKLDPLCSTTPAHVGVTVVYHSRSSYFSAIGLFSMKMVADRHRHAAYHNKHW